MEELKRLYNTSLTCYMSVHFLPASPPVRAASGSVLQLIDGLDLILPCYNPPGDWVNNLIRHYQEVLHTLPYITLQLILVNDGSTRNFGVEHINQLRVAIPGIIIVSYPVNRGKGYAVREGIKRASNNHQVCTDLDFPFGTTVIREAYEQLLNGADIVVGERGSTYLELLSAKRRVLTRLSRMINRVVLKLPVYDAQAGLKGFNITGRHILERTCVDGFLYDKVKASQYLFSAVPFVFPFVGTTNRRDFFRAG